MALRFISSDAAREDFANLLEKARDTGDEVVLKVDGVATAMVAPLNEKVQYEAFREAFGRFWEAQKSYLRENPPPDLSEDEVMEMALEIQREIRAKIRAEREAAETRTPDVATIGCT